MQKGWFHDMNQSQMLGEQIGRVLRTHGIQKVRIRPVKGAAGRENPVVIRRAYDIRTSCGRQNTDSAESPLLLHIRGEKNELLRYVEEGECVYFVHSFYASDCDDAVIATAEYGAPLTAAVAKCNVYGCQFHPEKSGTVGLNILRAFCETEG